MSPRTVVVVVVVVVVVSISLHGWTSRVDGWSRSDENLRLGGVCVVAEFIWVLVAHCAAGVALHGCSATIRVTTRIAGTSLLRGWIRELLGLFRPEMTLQVGFYDCPLHSPFVESVTGKLLVLVLVHLPAIVSRE